MTPLTEEWVEKAEGDYNVASGVWRARKWRNFDAICFHCQQCAEKYLKARLQESGISFHKTHNLTALLDRAIEIEPGWERLRSALTVLNEYAVDLRYPGFQADRIMAERAVRYCRQIRVTIRKSLRLRT